MNGKAASAWASLVQRSGAIAAHCVAVSDGGKAIGSGISAAWACEAAACAVPGAESRNTELMPETTNSLEDLIEYRRTALAAQTQMAVLVAATAAVQQVRTLYQNAATPCAYTR
eukprot:320854-Pleurochrysis_carterae.AAC.3